MMTLTWNETMTSATLLVDGVDAGNVHMINGEFYLYQDRSGEDQFLSCTAEGAAAKVASWNE